MAGPQEARTLARERAMQVLYRADLTGERTVEAVRGWATEREGGDLAYFETLVDGVLSGWDVLGEIVSRCAQNWSLGRMAVVDRTILRIGAYELMHSRGIPARVCLDEAVELAKRYGDAQSYSFVNGVLDRVLREHANRPPEETQPRETLGA
ncbi:MAG: transcription antitermination factor NusB [Planctomycetes bacterium]|nr:transcription antitermination factor NusB [Planctomycetota bacterium]